MRNSTHPAEELARLRALNDGLPLMHPTGKRIRYQEQESAAKRRGIAWEFTFDEWVAVWNDSGKWEHRGVGKGQYVMARHGDIGPYSRNNVAIILAAENTSEGTAKRPKPFGNTSRLGTGWGVTFHRRNKRNPYNAKFRNKSLGYYATEEEARAVYLAAVAAYQSELCRSEVRDDHASHFVAHA